MTCVTALDECVDTCLRRSTEILKLLVFSKLMKLFAIPFSMSILRWSASAVITLLASFTATTWAVAAEVAVANIPIIVAKIMGPEMTRRLLLDNACSILSGVSWMDVLLPFRDISCQNRFHASSLCDPIFSDIGPDFRDLFLKDEWILSISSFK